MKQIILLFFFILFVSSQTIENTENENQPNINQEIITIYGNEENIITSIETQEYKTKENIQIGENVIKIEKGAFYSFQMKQIQFPSSLQIIESFAFQSCDNLTTIIFQGDSSIEIIEDFAFDNCRKLTSFPIPKNLRNFSRKMFHNCPMINSFTIDTNHELFSMKNNIIVEKNQNGNEKILHYPSDIDDSHLSLNSLDNKIEVLSSHSFVESKYTSISLPLTPGIMVSSSKTASTGSTL